MPLNYKHLWKGRNPAGRQDHTLRFPHPAVGPGCQHVLGVLGCLRGVGLLCPTAWPEGGWGSTCHKVFGLCSSASILPGYVGKSGCSLGFQHPRPPTFSSGCWRLEIMEGAARVSSGGGTVVLGRGQSWRWSTKLIILSRDKWQYMDLLAWNMTMTLSCFGMELASLTMVYFGL